MLTARITKLLSEQNENEVEREVAVIQDGRAGKVLGNSNIYFYIEMTLISQGLT